MTGRTPIADARRDAQDHVLCALAGGDRREIAWRTAYRDLLAEVARLGVLTVDVDKLVDRAKEEAALAARMVTVSSALNSVHDQHHVTHYMKDHGPGFPMLAACGTRPYMFGQVEKVPASDVSCRRCRRSILKDIRQTGG